MKCVVFSLTGLSSLWVCLALVVAAVEVVAAPPAPAPLRKLDYSAAPELRDVAERVRQCANTYYPLVCALLADGDTRFPRQFDVCLKKDLPATHVGETRLGQVCLGVSYLEQLRNDQPGLEQLVVHELAHVAQHYTRPVLGRWLGWGPDLPRSWREGIAAYVTIKLGLTNAWDCAECSFAFPHYRDGYGCAGAFLVYVEDTYHPRLVRQLNTAMRRGNYSDAFFRAATGKDLPTLWSEFQRTAAFTRGAAQMLALQQKLGFENGKPPKDLARRLDSFLHQHADAGTRQLIQRALFPGLALKPGESQGCLALLCYLTQPGGSAEAFLLGLEEKSGLPGFDRGQKAMLDLVLSLRTLSNGFPAELSLTATKAGDTSLYHYTVRRPLLESPWQLQRAWRTDASGRLAEEYSLQ